jgi:hypothetical protein
MHRISFTALGLLVTSAGALAQTTSTQALAARSFPTPSVTLPPAPILGSDTCTTPTLVTGPGPFGYDTTGATTGTEGQATINCIFANQIGIDSDVWFEWVAPVTGAFEITNCGTAQNDSKIAVYSGTSSGTTCPTPAIVASGCNDDINALANTNAHLQSRVSFSTTAGKHYLIQIGGKPGSAQGSGTFQLDQVIVQPPYARHDNTPEVVYRLNGVTDTMWMESQGDITTGQRLVTAVKTAAGAAFAATQSNVVDGNPIMLGVWEDPNDDGNPSDAILLSTFTATVSLANTDTLVTYTLPSPVPVTNVFFIGASYSHGTGVGFPAPGDTNGCSSRPGQIYLGGNNGPFDFTLGANTVAPFVLSTVDSIAWLMEADTMPGSFGTIFCTGDGVAPHTACPCGNNSATIDAVGCLNSLGVGGRLRSMGTPSIGGDTLVLQGSQMPNSTCLYFQGTIQQNSGNGVVFGDGLRCAGGAVIRLGQELNAGGASMYPTGAQQPISVKGMVTTPSTRTYQGWYRNAAAFCTSATFNLSNGLEITWMP